MELHNGIYQGRAVRAQLGETKTGKEQVVVQFEITSPGYEGRTVMWFGFFTDKTAESTIKALRACGWHGDDLTVLDGVESNEVQLVVENETRDDGTVQPRVRWVNPIGGGALPGAPLAPDKAKAFAARMKAQVRAIDAGEGRRPAAPAARQTAPARTSVSDDIPF